MIQIAVWTRNGKKLHIEPSAGKLLRTPAREVEALPFPADQFSPEVAAALRRAYGEECDKGGTTTWRLLYFPLVEIRNVGLVPMAIFLVFEREGGRWMRTVGHALILSPSWFLRLPECCRKAVAGLAGVLLGDAAEVDIAA